MYKWIKTGMSVQRLTDNACVPNDAGNCDWRAFQEYVAAGGAVQAEDSPPTLDERAAFAVDGIDRLQFEHLFDLENRMRAQEGLAQITRAQYRTALINRWKQLNS